MEDNKMKTMQRHIEMVDDSDTKNDLKAGGLVKENFDGDVNLAGPGDVVYLIPSPSPDPRGEHIRGQVKALLTAGRSPQFIHRCKMGKSSVVFRFRQHS